MTGDNPLSATESDRVLSPYVRPDATLESLQKATASFEEVLRARGFGLYKVVLPPQEMGGTVTLHVVRFTVSSVTVEPVSIFDEANIRRSLPELQEGGTPNLNVLAVQTAIANENPSKQLRVRLGEGREADQVDVHIGVTASIPLKLSVSLSNAGSRSSGRDRLTVAGGYTNLFDRDHQVFGAYTTSVEDPRAVKQFGLSYKVPLYAWGGVLGAHFTRSDVVGSFGTFTSTGAGRTLGLSYTRHLQPQGGQRSHVYAGIEDKLFRAAMINDEIIGVDRRSRPVSAGYSSRTQQEAAVLAYSLELAYNTGGGRGNDLAAYRAENPAIRTTRWKAVRGTGSYSTTLARDFLLFTRGQYQYSPDALISGDQFGLGGLGSVRGTSVERPISGDSGLALTVEVTSPEIAKGLRLLGFVDGGWLHSHRPPPPRVTWDSLIGAGMGLRYASGVVVLAADYGRIVKGSRAPVQLNSFTPITGEHRLYLSVSAHL